MNTIKDDLKKLAKIPLIFDWTFFALLLFLPFSHYLIGGKIMGMASLVVLPTLFIFVLLHEYGHCWAAQRCGLRVQSVKLWFLGGLATIEGLGHIPPKQEAFISFAGPMVNLIIALIAGLWMMIAGNSLLVAYILLMNQVLAIFNLIPAFPMDGGRLLRSFLHWKTGDFYKATRSAASIGMFISFGFFFTGMAVGNFMLMFIFGYIGMTCYSILKNDNLIV